MTFTTITNGEGDAMRQLERKQATRKTTRKAPARPRKPKTARLLLANGELSEATRLGFSLVVGGVTGLSIGILEGLARRGKAEWWRKLKPHHRGLILIAFAIVAGVIARQRRKGGHIKSACALEAAAISAWTLAIVYFTEEGVGGKVEGLGDLHDRSLGEMGVDDLKALDNQIDDDIKSAARRLRELAEEEQTAAVDGMHDDEEEDADLGLLAYQGEEAVADDEDSY